MSDLDNLFSPCNKFVIPVTIHLTPDNKIKLLRYLNLHYLGDEAANEFVDGYYVAKHPKKETDEFKEAVHRASMGHTVFLSVEFNSNGIPTFTIATND